MSPLSRQIWKRPRQGLRKPIAYPVEHAIETIRIGIVEEKDIHRVVRRAERVCHKLRPERRAADPNVENVLETFSIFSRDFAAVNIFGEFLDAANRVFDFRPDFRCRRKRRIPQPVMTDHSLFCRISDCSRLQFSHRRERLLNPRLHFLEQIIRKFHAADVEGKTELTVFQEISLESLPE